MLLTLGRLPVALEIARAFKAQGWRVLVAETMAWHQCRLSDAVSACFVVESPVNDRERYQQQLLDIIISEAVSCVVPVSEEVLYVAGLRERLPRTVSLLCAPQRVVELLHDKGRFAQWAMTERLAVPETAQADSLDAQQLMDQHAYVIKPRLSCSGVGVQFGAPGDRPAASVINAEHVVQRQLTNSQCSCFAISVCGECRVIVAYRNLLESGSVGVRFERISTPAGVAEFTHAVVSKLHYDGMISFDFMQDSAGQWCAIECNPRATSGIHFVEGNEIVASLLAMIPPEQAQAEDAAGNQQLATSASGLLPVETRRQEFWSALTTTEGELFKGKIRIHLWKQLLSTRDVSWSAADWKPCVLMPFATWRLLWMAIRQRKPVSQVAMLDVGWYRRQGTAADRLPGAELPDVEVTLTDEMPMGCVALVESVTFGSDGLRYRRLNAAEQLTRFHAAVYVSAHAQGHLVGIYVLDRRQLVLGEQPLTGFYRSILAVAPEWQGRGVGQRLTDAAMVWLDEQALALSEPVLSYGCIDASNTRSVALLHKQGAQCIGKLSMYMMYRQWPQASTHLSVVKHDQEQQALLAASHADSQCRDETPSALPRLAFKDHHGTRISACAGVSEFRIVDMGFWLTWVTRLCVKPWPPARKRFNPERFQAVVFSKIAVRPGCEADWSRFVSAVLAHHGVHFGTVYPNPHTQQFRKVLRSVLLDRWCHSSTGSIQTMAKLHTPAVTPPAQSSVTDLAELGSRCHNLYPVDT